MVRVAAVMIVTEVMVMLIVIVIRIGANNTTRGAYNDKINKSEKKDKLKNMKKRLKSINFQQRPNKNKFERFIKPLRPLCGGRGVRSSQVAFFPRRPHIQATKEAQSQLVIKKL